MIKCPACRGAKGFAGRGWNYGNTIPCWFCKATGEVDPNDFEPCPDCADLSAEQKQKHFCKTCRDVEVVRKVAPNDPFPVDEPISGEW